MNPKYVIIIGLILVIFFLAYKKENFTVCDDIKQNCGLINIPQSLPALSSDIKDQATIDKYTTQIDNQNKKIKASRAECLSCTNCGICTNNAKSVCVNGDKEGPLFYSDCNKYEYGTNSPIINQVESKITPDLTYSYEDVLSSEVSQTGNINQSASTNDSCNKLCLNKQITTEVDSINCENCPKCGILTFNNVDYCVSVSDDDYNNIVQKVYTPIITNSDINNCLNTKNNAVLTGYNSKTNSNYEVCLELEE